MLARDHGIAADYLRLRALPVDVEVRAFIASHRVVYVVEQNRDAQCAGILRLECPAEATTIQSVLHYSGLPLDPQTVVEQIVAPRGRQGGPHVMTTAAPEKKPPSPAAKPRALNRRNLDLQTYKGLESTLCSGCGHDSITNGIIKALFDYGVPPHGVAKLSGIGCSSKTTAYFLGQSHGFNAVHGRMAAIAVGTGAANRTLFNIGVSGDGDTASIGLGHFMHMVRRNTRMVYLIENNGCYGLTKGQFSATADKGSKQKGGAVNHMPPIDCCALAIEMGCGYVARSFSGDSKQMLSLLKGAIAHQGTSVLDIVSPCVTFNNHEGSTKSYPYAKEHEELLNEVGFVPFFEEIHVDYEPGTTQLVELHDNSRITLKKLERAYDPTGPVRRPRPAPPRLRGAALPDGPHLLQRRDPDDARAAQPRPRAPRHPAGVAHPPPRVRPGGADGSVPLSRAKIALKSWRRAPFPGA